MARQLGLSISKIAALVRCSVIIRTRPRKEHSEPAAASRVAKAQIHVAWGVKGGLCGLTQQRRLIKLMLVLIERCQNT